MAPNSKKRQRKLEKKSSKRKSKKRDLIRATSVAPVELIRNQPDLPILASWRYQSLFHQGIGQVHIARKVPGGKVVFGMFLVDVFCLGVKDAFIQVEDVAKYQSKMAETAHKFPLKEIEPAAVRKLVEDAVDYALSFGIAPHSDYKKTSLIFGGIDPNECNEEFVFGREGKPFFCSGPYDSPSRCREILDTLQRSCGAGNFDYLMQISPASKMEFIDDDDYDDDDDDYDEGPRIIEG